MVHVVYEELKTVPSLNYLVTISLACIRFLNKEFEACKKTTMLETENFNFTHVKINTICATHKQELILNSEY